MYLSVMFIIRLTDESVDWYVIVYIRVVARTFDLF